MLLKICKNVLPSQREFLRHCSEKHKTRYGVPRITCPFDVCDRQFNNPNSFRRHIMVHSVVEQPAEPLEEHQQLLEPSSQQSIPLEASTSFFYSMNVEEDGGDETSDEEEFSDDDDFEENIYEPLTQSNIADNKIESSKSSKDLTSYRKDLEHDLFVKMVHLLADDTVSRKKTFQIVRGMHFSYGQVLNALVSHQKSKNIGDAESYSFIESIADPKFILSEHKVIQKVQDLELNVEYASPILDMQRPDALKKVFLHVLKIFDLCDLFTKLFALPNFFNEVLAYIDSIDKDSDWICNVVQSEYWKAVKLTLNLQDHELALPLFIYNDDFEPLNVLGSHRGAYKLSGVYAYMPCLPPQVQSKLEYIFLAMLFFATDRSSYGNDRVFAPFIDQLNKLQDGIKVSHAKYKCVKLIPIILLGDSLGLNTMMGFVQCFVANFYCRICRLNKVQMGTAICDDETKLGFIEI